MMVSLYYLIRPQQQRGWDVEAEGFRGLEIDDEIELARRAARALLWGPIVVW